MPEPDQPVVFCGPCFQPPPRYVNSLGFWDKEWNSKADFKIAVLGDSHVAARETSVDANLCALLEVLNAGVPGAGTVAEEMVYRKFVRPFKPNITLLLFTRSNDIHDNSCELSKALYPHQYRCARVTNGKIFFDTGFELEGKNKRSALSFPGKGSIKEHCVSCLLVYRFLFHNAYRLTHKGILQKNMLKWLEVYAFPRTKTWQDAWEITEDALVELKRDTEADGGRLLVAVVPEYVILSKTGPRELNAYTSYANIPVGFDFSFPSRRLGQICARHDIPLLDLEPYFLKYRDTFHLRFPYFSFRCDGHFNPLGQFLLFNYTAQYFIEHGWIPLADEEKIRLSRQIERNLRLSPLEILGEGAFGQIYRGGIYSGSSNVEKIMAEK
jgi:hypothetical protein